MKKIYHITCAAFVLILCSCSDLLDIEPRTTIDPKEIAFNDLETLLNGCYDGASFGGTQNKHLFLVSEDLSADNLAARGTAWGTDVVDRNAIPNDNANVTRWWNHCFVIVYRCNEFLGILNSFDASLFTGNRKQEMIAEARYIRAWAYYQLVAHWGGVPIMTEVTDDYVTRDSEADVWKFVYDELSEIESSAPEYSSRAYVSKQAVQALLARVALIRGDNATAKEKSFALMGNSQFELADDYSTIWKRTSKEIIMEWEATVNDPLSYGFFLNGSVGRYEMPVDETLVAAFEPNDKRKDPSVGELSSPIGGFKYECKKYWITGNGDDSWPVARIAEAYLIYAEASGYPDGVATLNLLRNKRGLGDISPTSEEDFLDAILSERRVEFAFEGLRWTDLKRMKRVSEFVTNIESEDDKNILYPIPLTALDTNPNLEPNY